METVSDAGLTVLNAVELVTKLRIGCRAGPESRLRSCHPPIPDRHSDIPGEGV